MLLGVFVLLTVGAAGFVGYKKYELDQAIKTNTAKLNTLDTKIQELEQKQKVGEVFRAKQILAKAEGLRTEWSEVFTKLYVLIQSTAGVDLASLSSSGENIQVAAKADNFADVSKLLNKLLFDEDAIKVVEDPFVSSVGGVSSDDVFSQNKVEFQLLLNYKNQ